MGYSDQKFYARPLVKVSQSADLGTATAAGTASNSLVMPSANPLPSYTHKTSINNIRVNVITAPNVSATPLVLAFANGTNTFGTVNIATATASQVVAGVITSAVNAVIAAGGQPTYGLVGTFTASGGTGGKYDIFFEQIEQFVTP